MCWSGGVRFPASAMHFSSFQTGSVAHPDFHLMGTMGSIPGAKAPEA